MGGAKRYREPEEEDAYRWLMLRFESVERGVDEMLRGMRHQHRAIKILAEKEKADDE